MSKFKFLAFAVSILSSNIGFTTDKRNSDSMPSWQQTKHGVTFFLQQLSFDQVTAFYLGRGFSKDQIAPYAKTCVYTVVLRNDKAPGRIRFVRNTWKLKTGQESHNIQDNAKWLALFRQTKVKPSALIAFRLAQFPEEHEYEPGGDWNQGMLSVGLPFGRVFDITINWFVADKIYELTLQEINCVKQITN